jgi:hypothetical protein
MSGDRPGNGRPVQFLDFVCGHSKPVRGQGARVPRLCEVCALTGRAGGVGLGELALRQLLGMSQRATTAHPGPYCDCEPCRSRLP